MSTPIAVDTTAFLAGVEHGERTAAALGIAQLVEKEEHERHLLEVLAVLRAENSRLRRRLDRCSPQTAVRWSLVTSFLSFLFAWNLAENGWFW